MAVQLLRVLTAARIIAVDTRADALELAAAAGADVTLSADGLDPREVRAAAGGGAAVVIDCVGVQSTLDLAAGAVRAGGHVAIVGIGGGTFPMRFRGVPFETTVVISNWGTRSELADVVALAQEGAIHMEVERVRLDEVVEAYVRLEAGDVRGRVVAAP
jgi:propanol-preferring alcohol dehydrogenase